VPIAEKASFRWLENLRQSTALTSNPGDCVHLGDRESDIFELFSLAHELGTNFLVRTCVDRLAEDAGTTVAAQMKKAPVKGRHRVQGRTKQGESYEADLDIKYEQLQVLPPEGKWKDYADLTLTVIHAVERGTPLVMNCVLSGNSTGDSGGGAYRGVLNHCTFSGNTATNNGGGALVSKLISCTLTDCALTVNSATYAGGGVNNYTVSNCVLTANTSSPFGAGASSSALDHCTLSWISAFHSGGGGYQSVLNNCLVISNTAGAYAGGGAYYSTLNNCTVAGNSAPQGGGVKNCTANNCIVYFNPGQNYDFTSTLNYSCALEPGAYGNIANEPLFMDMTAGDFRLQPDSPCINSGKNSLAPSVTDFSNSSRFIAGTVDIGAYEVQSASSVLSYAWAQQFGLPTDGSADYADTDGDGLNNWQEWIAGTDPTNSTSVLRILSPSNTLAGWRVTW